MSRFVEEFKPHFEDTRSQCLSISRETARCHHAKHFTLRHPISSSNKPRRGLRFSCKNGWLHRTYYCTMCYIRFASQAKVVSSAFPLLPRTNPERDDVHRRTNPTRNIRLTYVISMRCAATSQDSNKSIHCSASLPRHQSRHHSTDSPTTRPKLLERIISKENTPASRGANSLLFLGGSALLGLACRCPPHEALSEPFCGQCLLGTRLWSVCRL